MTFVHITKLPVVERKLVLKEENLCTSDGCFKTRSVS